MPTRAPCVAYIRSNQRPECFCWDQFPKVGGGYGVFISGWVLTAFADLGEPLSVAELDSVLTLQDRKGWCRCTPSARPALCLDIFDDLAGRGQTTKIALAAASEQARQPGFEQRFRLCAAQADCRARQGFAAIVPRRLANLPPPTAIEANPNETSFEEPIGSKHTSVDTIVQMTVP